MIDRVGGWLCPNPFWRGPPQRLMSAADDVYLVGVRRHCKRKFRGKFPCVVLAARIRNPPARITLIRRGDFRPSPDNDNESAPASMSFNTLAFPAPRIMICEDEALLACDLRDEVRSFGCDVVGPFSSQREGIRALGREAVDAVILDVELEDGASTRLAGMLRDQGIPFLVVSGLATSTPPPEFAEAEWLLKPADTQRVRAFCESVQRARRCAPVGPTRAAGAQARA